jgi:hypothetical protein
VRSLTEGCRSTRRWWTGCPVLPRESVSASSPSRRRARPLGRTLPTRPIPTRRGPGVRSLRPGSGGPGPKVTTSVPSLRSAVDQLPGAPEGARGRFWPVTSFAAPVSGSRLGRDQHDALEIVAVGPCVCTRQPPDLPAPTHPGPGVRTLRCGSCGRHPRVTTSVPWRPVTVGGRPARPVVAFVLSGERCRRDLHRLLSIGSGRSVERV